MKLPACVLYRRARPQKSYSGTPLARAPAGGRPTAVAGLRYVRHKHIVQVMAFAGAQVPINSDMWLLVLEFAVQVTYLLAAMARAWPFWPWAAARMLIFLHGSPVYLQGPTRKPGAPRRAGGAAGRRPPCPFPCMGVI